MTSSPAPSDVPIRRFTKVEWLDPPPPNQPALPIPLVNSAIAINEAKRALHVGGFSVSLAESVNAVAEFDFNSKVWSSTGIEKFPYKISEGALVSIGNKYYYYGGWDDEFCRGDIHVMSGQQGTGEAKGAIWECLFRGGYQGKRAEKLHNADGKPFPKSRRGASMVAGTLCDRSVLFIFGGFDGTRRLNDLWAFDVDSFEWIDIQTHEQNPSLASIRRTADQRLANAAAMKPTTGAGSYMARLSMFMASANVSLGGASPGATAADGNITGAVVSASTSAQTQPLQVPSNAVNNQMSPANSPLSYAPSPSTGVNALAGGKNASVSGASGLQPPIPTIAGSAPAPLPPASHPAVPTGRDGAAMAFDALQNRLLLFGGYDDGPLNDVYELRFDPATTSVVPASVAAANRNTASKNGGGHSPAAEWMRSSRRASHDEYLLNGSSGAATTASPGAAHDGSSEFIDETKVRGLVVEERHAEWRKLATINPPLPRQGCFALINGPYFIVGYGKEVRTGPSKLLFQLNLNDSSWTICNLEGDDNSEARYGAAIGTQSDNKRSLVMGGVTNDGRYLFSGFEIDWERPEAVGGGKGKR